MPTLVITYGTPDDQGLAPITGHRYEANDYALADGELAVDGVPPMRLALKQVDTTTDPPTLVDRTTGSLPAQVPALRSEGPLLRGEISEPTKQAFRDARAADDLQGQLDVLFTILTGEQP